MENMNMLKGFFFLGGILFFTSQICCMELEQKKVEPQLKEIKRLVKLFLENLYRKKEYLEKKYYSCIDKKKFDLNWEYTVIDRTPVSFKLKIKEENTSLIFQEIFKKYNTCKVYFLLTNPIQGEGLQKIYKEALLELMFECSRSLYMYEIVDQKYKRKLEKSRFSTPVRNKIKQERNDECKKCIFALKYDFYKAMFFLNQVPELRRQIFECYGQDNTVRKFLYGLKKGGEYSCYSPEEERGGIELRQLIEGTVVTQEFESDSKENLLVV